MVELGLYRPEKSSLKFNHYIKKNYLKIGEFVFIILSKISDLKNETKITLFNEKYSQSILFKCNGLIKKQFCNFEL